MTVTHSPTFTGTLCGARSKNLDTRPTCLRCKRRIAASMEIQRRRTVRTAQQHAEADQACGRAWTCQCGACRASRSGALDAP